MKAENRLNLMDCDIFSEVNQLIIFHAVYLCDSGASRVNWEVYHNQYTQ